MSRRPWVGLCILAFLLCAGHAIAQDKHVDLKLSSWLPPRYVAYFAAEPSAPILMRNKSFPPPDRGCSASGVTGKSVDCVQPAT